MSTALDKTLVPFTKDIIGRLGLDATFKQYTPGTYDLVTGVGVPGTNSTVAKVSPPMPYDTRLVDNDLIRVGDAVCYIAEKDLPFIPKAGMLVTFADTSEEWRCIEVNSLRSGEDIAVHELQLRH